MPPVYENFDLGQRLDGTYKGPGFASATLPDGSVMTELSLGPAESLYPAVYQDITPWDLQTLVNVGTYGYDPLQGEVFQRAYEASLLRAVQGLPPFWQPSDGWTGLNYTPRY